MDDQEPASISLPVHNILRNELGFDGVIITDDLVMEGVRQFAGDAEIAVRAVQAGNDMLCCTDFEVQDVYKRQFTKSAFDQECKKGNYSFYFCISIR